MVAGIKMDLGDGKLTKFWEDVWLQNSNLRELFPRLFSLSNQKEYFVGDCGFWDGVEWIWNFQWRRMLFQWELGFLDELNSLLATVKLNRYSNDRIIWKFDKKGIFSVGSVSKVWMAEQNRMSGVNSFHFTKSVWKGLVPPKVEIFAWFILIGRLNTKDRLHNFGIIPRNQLMCCMCNKEHESIEHLFFSCDFAWHLWWFWLMKWNVFWVSPNNQKLFFEVWMGVKLRKESKKHWYIAFFVVIWTIWRCRNICIFENKVIRQQEHGKNVFCTME